MNAAFATPENPIELLKVPPSTERTREVGAAATPVPVNEMATLACAGSLVASVSVPVCAPAAVGANCTDRFAEPPAAMLAAPVSDVALGVNSVLLVVIELTVSAALPTLAIVSAIA